MNFYHQVSHSMAYLSDHERGFLEQLKNEYHNGFLMGDFNIIKTDECNKNLSR